MKNKFDDIVKENRRLRKIVKRYHKEISLLEGHVKKSCRPLVYIGYRREDPAEEFHCRLSDAKDALKALNKIRSSYSN